MRRAYDRCPLCPHQARHESLVCRGSQRLREDVRQLICGGYVLGLKYVAGNSIAKFIGGAKDVLGLLESYRIVGKLHSGL